MKFCYIDESGTGDEPYAVMVGVLIDAVRMKPTKGDWEGLLRDLSKELGREIKEIYTRDFYAGNGPWRGLDGAARSHITEAILDWVAVVGLGEGRYLNRELLDKGLAWVY